MSQGPEFRPATDSRARFRRYHVELPHAGIVETERNRFESPRTEYAERRAGWKGRYLELRDRLLGVTLARFTVLRASAPEQGQGACRLLVRRAFVCCLRNAGVLFVLVLAGPAAIKYSLPIAGCIALLLAIVIASYRQTVRAYPSGGGAYIVAHENLGIGAGLIAASALLIDYVLYSRYRSPQAWMRLPR